MADPGTSIRSLLTQAVASLPGDSARLDAEVLLAACLDMPRSYLHAWPERTIDDATRQQYENWIQRRANGEPVAHLTGVREFWSLPLTVTPDTLIPRPETETLVELALAKLPDDRACRVADLGTGSGAIALAIASERPRCVIIATDNSASALAVAQENAERLGIRNVHFVAGHWCEPLPDSLFDFILGNPPYIAVGDPHLDTGDVRYEPPTALAAGSDGLDALRTITSTARVHLRPGGWLVVEHGYDQGDYVARLFCASGYTEVSTHSDSAGLSRVTMGRHPA
ncbi:MAG: peptide chain release factor N(5)-glutamine methyltransferase [Pseudomonadota bacterium]